MGDGHGKTSSHPRGNRGQSCTPAYTVGAKKLHKIAQKKRAPVWWGPWPAGAVLRTLRVGGAFPRPRGAAPRCPPGPGRGPGFLWKKAGGKNTREEEVLPPWTHLFWFGGTLRGSSFFFCLACGPVSHARNGPPPGWAGWEGWEFWDPLRWAPKIGGCTPNRASKAGTLGVRRVFCPARVRAKNRLDFIPALARAGSLRRWVLLYPKPSPWGEAVCEAD